MNNPTDQPTSPAALRSQVACDMELTAEWMNRSMPARQISEGGAMTFTVHVKNVSPDLIRAYFPFIDITIRVLVDADFDADLWYSLESLRPGAVHTQSPSREDFIVLEPGDGQSWSVSTAEGLMQHSRRHPWIGMPFEDVVDHLSLNDPSAWTPVGQSTPEQSYIPIVEVRRLVRALPPGRYVSTFDLNSQAGHCSTRPIEFVVSPR